MIGAIVGDIIGSKYEFNHIVKRNKHFPIFDRDGLFENDTWLTDDSICTVAVASAIYATRETKTDASENFRDFLFEFMQKFPNYGYGGRFAAWGFDEECLKQPYGSWGNGASMRVSPCGFLAESEEEAVEFADKATAVSHNSEMAMSWARAVAVGCYRMKHGAGKDAVVELMPDRSVLDKSMEELWRSARFTCRSDMSVSEAIAAFVKSESFEDAIRNAIALGADADTQAAIAGSLAGAYYGVPEKFKRATALRIRNLMYPDKLEFLAFWLKRSLGFDIYAYA